MNGRFEAAKRVKGSATKAPWTKLFILKYFNFYVVEKKAYSLTTTAKNVKILIAKGRNSEPDPVPF